MSAVPPTDPDEAEPHRDPVSQVSISGKAYPVYLPTSELWPKLFEVEDALKTEGYLEEIEPILFRGGALARVANDCCKLPDRMGEPGYWMASYENVGAVVEIIETWDTSYYWTAYFYGFVQECVRRVLFHLLDTDRRISLIRDPHPELREEAMAAGKQAAAYTAPAPPDLYETEAELGESSDQAPEPGPLETHATEGTGGIKPDIREGQTRFDPRASPLKKEDMALGTLAHYPEWSDTKIADYIDCARTSLYRMERFKAARRVLKARKRDIPRGRKDGTTGTVEAEFSDD